MYVSMKGMLKRANEGNYAVMAINCFNIETARAVINAAQSLRAPSIINIINALGASKFAKVIAGHVPDVIICTHVFAAQMVDELKKRKKLADIETIGIVTDYTLHPYW